MCTLHIRLVPFLLNKVFVCFWLSLEKETSPLPVKGCKELGPRTANVALSIWKWLSSNSQQMDPSWFHVCSYDVIFKLALELWRHHHRNTTIAKFICYIFIFHIHSDLRSFFCNHRRLERFQRILCKSKPFGSRDGGKEILSSEGSLTCHTSCDTCLPFIMVMSEDPWHSHLLPSVWQWSCHYLFLRLRYVATVDRTTISRMRSYATAAVVTSEVTKGEA